MRKDMLIILLLTLCLVPTLVALAPARTNNATQQEAQKIEIIYSTKSWTTIVKCPLLRTKWLWNSTEGYRQISFSITSTGNCTIYVEFLYRIDEFNLTKNTPEGRTYDIIGPRILIGIENPNNQPITVYFVFYMTA